MFPAEHSRALLARPDLREGKKLFLAFIARVDGNFCGTSYGEDEVVHGGSTTITWYADRVDMRTTNYFYLNVHVL